MARACAVDLRDVLPQVQVPTLLLYGDKDVRAPLSVGHALHAAIPNSKLVVMPGVGHVSSVEAAEQFNLEFAGFSGGSTMLAGVDIRRESKEAIMIID
jgi:pimeloyl-ACP methyl ester carboxylesterase